MGTERVNISSIIIIYIIYIYLLFILYIYIYIYIYIYLFLDVEKLSTFCLQFGLPAVRRPMVWKLLLGELTLLVIFVH